MQPWPGIPPALASVPHVDLSWHSFACHTATAVQSTACSTTLAARPRGPLPCSSPMHNPLHYQAPCACFMQPHVASGHSVCSHACEHRASTVHGATPTRKLRHNPPTHTPLSAQRGSGNAECARLTALAQSFSRTQGRRAVVLTCHSANDGGMPTKSGV